MHSEITKVIHFFGDQKSLAKALGLSEYAVSRWVKQVYIPSARIWEVKQIIGEKTTVFGERITIEGLLREAYEKQHPQNSRTYKSNVAIK